VAYSLEFLNPLHTEVSHSLLVARRLVVLASVKSIIQHTPDPSLVFVDVFLRKGAICDQVVDLPVERLYMRE
jgi:hypothetical protein